MTDVRTRSLADRRVISRYGFAVINRRHIVAATELQPACSEGAASSEVRVPRPKTSGRASSRPAMSAPAASDQGTGPRRPSGALRQRGK